MANRPNIHEQKTHTDFLQFRQTPDFLPITHQEGGVDFVLVTADAYVDHPSFGAIVIGKLLYAAGYSVGVISSPDHTQQSDFTVFGRPKLAFLVTSGNVDSMVNNYSVSKKKRNKDEYAENGTFGQRPDRALSVYSRKIREIYGSDIPIVLGGLEASLRRLAHYDYWSNAVRKSVLLDASANLLVYGMGERTILEIAALLAAGVLVKDICYVKGTVFRMGTFKNPNDGLNHLENQHTIVLPSFEEVSQNKKAYAESFRIQYENTDFLTAKALIEPTGKAYVVQNPPAEPLTSSELDVVYGLHYARRAHPIYKGVVPSLLEVQMSLVANRGCFGGCNFCALTFHQGKRVVGRGENSLLSEATIITNMKEFKGYIHDVGGPTANFHQPSCSYQEKHGVCAHKKCLTPTPCKNLAVSHKNYLNVLRKIRALPKIKKVFIRSGIRFDYLIEDKNKEFFNELCEHHISGQLKVAPEHVSNVVLEAMGKSKQSVYDRFVEKYEKTNQHLGKNQFLVPYFMSSHPGSGLKEAIELAEYLRDHHISPQQVQDFYPTPGTISTCMYYTELNPLTMKPVFVAKDPHEKAMQRALVQYKLPQNYDLVCEALTKANRRDLIGFGPKCLVRPKNTQKRFVPPASTSFPPKKKTIRNIHKKKR